MDEESKRNEGICGRNKHNNTPSTAFSSTSNGTAKNTKRTPKNKIKFNFNCHNCGLPGHKRIDCRKKPQKIKPANESSVAQIASDNKEDVYSFATSI